MPASAHVRGGQFAASGETGSTSTLRIIDIAQRPQSLQADGQHPKLQLTQPEEYTYVLFGIISKERSDASTFLALGYALAVQRAVRSLQQNTRTDGGQVQVRDQ